MSARPIRDRVRARKMRQLLVRVNWALAAINVVILVAILVAWL